jgi:hypothetical protein
MEHGELAEHIKPTVEERKKSTEAVRAARKEYEDDLTLEALEALGDRDREIPRFVAFFVYGKLKELADEGRADAETLILARNFEVALDIAD